MNRLKAFDWITGILLIIGGLLWGLIAINPSWDVLAMLFGGDTTFVRIVYGLVGLSALYFMFVIGRFGRR